MSRARLGRNDGCLCLSGKKYKNCCEGDIDWRKIENNEGDVIHNLSVRGRNIIFLDSLSDILGLENIRDLKEYKKAITVDVVKKIHELIVALWPKNTEINTLLGRYKRETVGLYIGDYHRQYIEKSVVRHSIYAQKMVLVDPFVYPLSVRDEFNPILNPEQYLTQTLKNVNLWLSMEPLIRAGIVDVIRTPGDFDPVLQMESMKYQKRKFQNSDALRAALKKDVAQFQTRHLAELKKRDLFLSLPDSSLIEQLGRYGGPKVSEPELLEYVNDLRDSDPDFLAPADKFGPQLHIMTAGTSFDMARIISDMSDCYFVTDMRARWKEIELERTALGDSANNWSPLAKAFHESPLKYLNNVSFSHVLQLREKDRLSSMRAFMRKVWSAVGSENEYSDSKAKMLADELSHEVAIANEEWHQIDRDLLLWGGAEFAAGVLVAGPAIASGSGMLVGAASVAAGVANLVNSTMKRRSFPIKYPAAFFMNIQD